MDLRKAKEASDLAFSKYLEAVASGKSGSEACQVAFDAYMDFNPAQYPMPVVIREVRK